MTGELFGVRPAGGPFTILTVCTGNVCRSPLAQALLELVLRGLPVRVASAGTRALAGEPPTEQTERIARDLGAGHAAAHRARQLTADDLRGADLVLTADRGHRRAVAELLPRAARVAFTLREFARVAEAVPGDALPRPAVEDAGGRLRDAVAAAARLRGMAPAPADAAGDDIVDPYRRSDEVYEAAASQLVPAVNAAAAFLRRAATGGG